ncbi:shikimate kinase [Roseibium limicola]|uniref:Shikimate kinase n=1 Tax=Roseibium limicola TaxID=2816037 RepID=A0A939J692_9HYPH|nr:shikimate kinase [Roseibium limicola]MBO0346625.1 shikimate kinase [Roseibium limicola]
MKRENQNHSANEQAALAQDEARDGFLPRAQLVDLLGQRSIVLIGIMGSGKSTVGRRLAHRMGLKFVDADNAIQEAANMTIPEIFASHGEAYFRSGEERVIARLLQEGPQVLATGGGAYMSGSTREAIAEAGISIWLNADFETVMARVRKRTSRPLLQTPDPEGTMRQLMADRYPIYAKADVEIHSRDVPHETVAEDIMIGLSQYLLSTSASNGTRDLEVPVAD